MDFSTFNIEIPAINGSSNGAGNITGSTKAIQIEKLSRAPSSSSIQRTIPENTLKVVDRQSLQLATWKARNDLESILNLSSKDVMIEDKLGSRNPRYQSPECVVRYFAAESSPNPLKMVKEKSENTKIHSRSDKFYRDLEEIILDNPVSELKKNRMKMAPQKQQKISHPEVILSEEEIGWLGKNNRKLEKTVSSTSNNKREEKLVSSSHVAKLSPQENKKELSDVEEYPINSGLKRNAELLLDRIEIREEQLKQRLANLTLSSVSSETTTIPTRNPSPILPARWLFPSNLSKPKATEVEFIGADGPLTVYEDKIREYHTPTPTKSQSTLTTDSILSLIGDPVWLDNLLKKELELT